MILQSNESHKKAPVLIIGFLDHIASLVKLLTAGVIASLVHDDTCGVEWDTPIREYLPEFGKRQDCIGQEATVKDLLSNRTGLAVSHASFAHQRAEMVISRGGTVKTAASVEAVAPFRRKFVYSQWNYSLLTDIVEKVTDKTFGAVAQERFLRPLGMTRTHFGPHGNGDNDAKSHAVRDDFSAYEILSPGATDETGLAGAVGCKSSLRDILVMYQTFLSAVAHQQKNNTASTPGSPWKYTQEILDPRVAVGSDIEKLAYCLGVYRTTLPGVLSVSSMNQQLFRAAGYSIPQVGSKNKDLEVFLHTAALPGCHGSMFMVPSIESAVVVLANALPLVDSTDFVAQLALSIILGETPLEEQFISMSEMAQSFQLIGYARLSEQLEKKKTHVPPSLPLEEYGGEYHNAAGNIIYCVTVCGEHLRMTVKGTIRTHFDLLPYDGDSFYWKADREWELCEKGMWPFLSPEWHKIHFNLSAYGHVESFTWHHDPLGSPEVFRNHKDMVRSRIWARM